MGRARSGSSVRLNEVCRGRRSRWNGRVDPRLAKTAHGRGCVSEDARRGALDPTWRRLLAHIIHMMKRAAAGETGTRVNRSSPSAQRHRHKTQSERRTASNYSTDDTVTAWPPSYHGEQIKDAIPVAYSSPWPPCLSCTFGSRMRCDLT